MGDVEGQSHPSTGSRSCERHTGSVRKKTGLLLQADVGNPACLQAPSCGHGAAGAAAAEPG